mmetsp:Transcript_17836/g.41879  ORF Transcript_17836/g.41879 Transcript_17836/m.41879 type:complete len:274 (+) Transcript_17836:1-822(+)
MSVTLFNLLRVAQLNQLRLERMELSTQASHLHVQTLEDARCSHPRDEARLRQAIAGCEEAVDTAIRVLMEAGAYTESLRRRYEAGLDIRGLGQADLLIKTFHNLLLWCLSIVDSVGFLETYAACRDRRRFFLKASIPILIGTTLLMPLLTLMSVRKGGPHRGVLAVLVWTRSAMLSLGVPLLIEIDCHLLKAAGMLQMGQCPEMITWYMVTLFRPSVAILAVVWTLSDGMLWVQRFALERARTSLGREEPETESSSSDSSDTSCLSRRLSSHS